MTTGDGKDQGKASAPAGSGDEEMARRLRELGRRIDTVEKDRKAVEQSTRASAGRSDLGRAFRMSTEFIAGVIVGGGIGWVIDRSLGSSPWGLFVFLMLGFGAGIMNMMRTAGFGGKKSHGGPEDPGTPSAQG